jgi:hypothetical protein
MSGAPFGAIALLASPIHKYGKRSLRYRFKGEIGLKYIHYCQNSFDVIQPRLSLLDLGDNCHEGFGTDLMDKSPPRLLEEKVGTREEKRGPK